MNDNYKHLDNWTLRPNQIEALEKIKAAYKSGKKVVVLEGPTGSGKSLIGITASTLFSRSNYLVPLKSLQDQIWNDFSEVPALDAAIFKGKANYNCALYKNELVSVEDAFCQDPSSREQRSICKRDSVCPYYNAMKRINESNLAIVNFSLYLAWKRIEEKTLNIPVRKREFHIIDEAHKIESNIRDFLTIEITDYQLFKHFGLKFPTYLTEHSEEEELLEFFKKVKVLNDRVLQAMMKKYFCSSPQDLDLKATESKVLSDLVSFHTSLNDKLIRFLADIDNYAFKFGKRFRYKEEMSYVIAKPLNVGGYVKECVLGDFTLLMSATIPKSKILSLGLSEDEFEYIPMASTFPKQNRMIYFKNLGTMNQKSMDNLFPSIVDNTVKILKKNNDSKGIIHAPSYKVANILEQSLRKDYPELANRILLQSQETEGAKKILRYHMESSEPTVLLSPGMKEGIDLKNELSRFQIIIKCPFPSLSDPVVAKMSNLNYTWYVTEALIDFFQMYGRSIRSETDWAETYVFDNHLRGLLVKYKFLVPPYILEACKWVA